MHRFNFAKKNRFSCQYYYWCFPLSACRSLKPTLPSIFYIHCPYSALLLRDYPLHNIRKINENTKLKKNQHRFLCSTRHFEENYLFFKRILMNFLLNNTVIIFINCFLISHLIIKTIVN